MSVPALRSGIEQVHVVIPARDEEALLPDALASVARAADRLLAADSSVSVSTTVVADACGDATAATAAAYGAHVVVADLRNVGAARRLGVEHATVGGGLDDRRVWLANTDADCVVPDHWLLAQLELAAAGFAMVVGTVVPAPADLTPALGSRWHGRHDLVEGHPHMHGANLGLLLAAYRSVGGFPPLTVHEDVRLVAEVRARDWRWSATHTTCVTASGRRHGRTADGFAAYLLALEQDDERTA
ncbi:MAG: glycosyltransferase [Nocardioides sp.]